LSASADGLSPSSIRLLPEQGSSYKRPTTETAYDHQRDEGGFWNSLSDFALPDEDRYIYAEGMSRGGIALAITADEANYDRISDIIERYGSIDVDALEADWKQSGWTGYTADAGIRATSDMASERVVGGDEVIPIVEERLQVGKRAVEGGRVRVRAYVVETPVEAEVDLRSERVTIERRPVDRAIAPGDVDLFRDQTLEAHERREEAVVSKDARVVEEIGLREETEVQHQRIQDTVRKTEVEVDDERGVASEVEAERLRRTGPLTD
jgi:uncharacterized protein (TIGR02271 family)